VNTISPTDWFAFLPERLRECYHRSRCPPI
jgi:hypothetical protein